VDKKMTLQKKGWQGKEEWGSSMFEGEEQKKKSKVKWCRYRHREQGGEDGVESPNKTGLGRRTIPFRTIKKVRSIRRGKKNTEDAKNSHNAPPKDKKRREIRTKSMGNEFSLEFP